MGYTTDFSGEFKLDSPLTPEQIEYLKRFNSSRRMKRDASVVATFPDPLREAVGLPIGVEGGYYVGNDEGDNTPLTEDDPRTPTLARVREWFPSWDEDTCCKHRESLIAGKHGGVFAGQLHDASVVDYNDPPRGQLSLWNQWVPNEDGTAIEWDAGEKFYKYTRWLEYIIEHFLKPWGKTINGEVEWVGEDSSDIGKIIVEDNIVRTLVGHIVYE